MISYEPLEKTMRDRGVTYYQLSYKYGMNANTVQRLRKKCGISEKTINQLCEILNCKVEDILEYIPDDTPADD